MKIELNQGEITEAIVARLDNMGIVTAGKDIAVKFVAGRKENGNTVEITVTEKSTPDNVTNIASVETTNEAAETPEVEDNKKTTIQEEVADLDGAQGDDSIFQS